MKADFIDVPLLDTVGRFDQIAAANFLKTLRRLRPDRKVDMIGADHLILQLEPARAAEVIERLDIMASGAASACRMHAVRTQRADAAPLAKE